MQKWSLLCPKQGIKSILSREEYQQHGCHFAKPIFFWGGNKEQRSPRSRGQLVELIVSRVGKPGEAWAKPSLEVRFRQELRADEKGINQICVRPKKLLKISEEYKCIVD